MERIKGIKYTKSEGRSYVRIDLDMYGGNQALEDFLDFIDVVAQKGRETVSSKEFNRRIDELLQANVTR